MISPHWKAWILPARAQFVKSHLANVELGGVKRGKSYQSITAAQAAILN